MGLGKPTLVIGIDCATDPAKIGLASGLWESGGLHLTAAKRGSDVGGSLTAIADELAGWLHAGLREVGRALVAMDAPLGWPQPLVQALATHVAGAPLPADADRLFKRHTDRAIEQRLGQRPLEVGADRIARTAWAALRLLNALRVAMAGPAIPLAERPNCFGPLAAIEVYPSATRLAGQSPSLQYKGRQPGAPEARQALLTWLQETQGVAVPAGLEPALLQSEHLLDAALCLAAGRDFLTGRAVPPAPAEWPLARKEGWIWVAGKEPSCGG